MNIEQATVDAVLEDWTTAEVSERVRGGLRLVETLTRHPQDIDTAFIIELDDAGLDEVAMEDAANVAFHFNFMNRLADAFDFPLLDDRQRGRMSRVLQFAGRFGGSRREPSYSWGPDAIVRPVEVGQAREQALTVAGETEPSLRRAVEAYAASWFGGQRSGATEVAEPLCSYVEKVARWAHRVVDEDIDALRVAGYGDEAIFELTIAAALGAATPALERLFGVLYEPAMTMESPFADNHVPPRRS